MACCGWLVVLCAFLSYVITYFIFNFFPSHHVCMCVRAACMRVMCVCVHACMHVTCVCVCDACVMCYVCACMHACM